VKQLFYSDTSGLAV